MDFETFAQEFVTAMAFGAIPLKVAVALEVGNGLEFGLARGLALEPEVIASVSFVGLQETPYYSKPP
jgi:hypothetical protein